MVGISCLVADSAAGPWALPSGVDVLVKPERDGKSWDADRVLNPRHVYLDGKWFMYYKGIRKGVPTENGLAIADTLTGPYRKYERNPLLIGHGHFCWRYKHGMLMIPNFGDMAGERGERWIHWSEDGIHFVPIEKSNNVFPFGSFYSPYDPLFGEPQTGEPTMEFWGFESVKPPDRAWDVERHRMATWLTGPRRKSANKSDARDGIQPRVIRSVPRAGARGISALTSFRGLIPSARTARLRNKTAAPNKAGSQACGLLSIFIGERRNSMSRIKKVILEVSS